MSVFEGKLNFKQDYKVKCVKTLKTSTDAHVVHKRFGYIHCSVCHLDMVILNVKKK